MHEPGKSDEPIVPTKPPNEAGQLPAEEVVEGRGEAKGNSSPQNTPRTQSRDGVRSARERIRQAAKRSRNMRFTSLLHHIANVEALREAYEQLQRDASAGVDGVTWRHYGQDLPANLADLSSRLKRGAYRAKPVRRAYIPKADGRQRPLGVPTVEDKLVQRATATVLEAIYETDFLGISYGFRPKRRAHDALDALAVGLEKRKVNWLLDADIRGYFDSINHGWLVRFLEHRIADKRVLRLIQKWLNAGVLEKGSYTYPDQGTPQGGSISPLLANIYLHYVFDLWVSQWRKTQARGDVIVVRYADDFVVGFESKTEAEQFWTALKERFQRFGLELHAEKTRLVEFGRYAARDREKRGQGKPETFDFLGFTHICGTTKKGWFRVVRRTIAKRLRAKLQELKANLARRRHLHVEKTGMWLGAVLKGYFGYHAVPLNTQPLDGFRTEVIRLWKRSLERRSDKGAIRWDHMAVLARRFLPRVRVRHRYPNQRLRVTTQGWSRVR